MASKAKDGGAKASKFIRPWLCVTGVMFLWAAQNQPPLFTTASLAIWGLTSLAVGLVAGAVCAFIQPLIVALGRASDEMAKARAFEQARAEQAAAAAALAGEARAAAAAAAGPPGAGSPAAGTPAAGTNKS